MNQKPCAGLPCYIWLEVFHDCHEWHWDGGELAAKSGKNKIIRSGSYHRLEWPYGGAVMEQPNIVVEVFSAAADEYERMLFSKAK